MGMIIAQFGFFLSPVFSGLLLACYSIFSFFVITYFHKVLHAVFPRWFVMFVSWG